MKTIVFTETDVSPESGRVRLLRPTARHGFYRDIAVLALPLGETTSVEAGTQTMAVTETGPTTVDFTATRPFAPRSLVFTPSDAMICFKATVEALNEAGAWQTVGEATYRNYAAVSTHRAEGRDLDFVARRLAAGRAARAIRASRTGVPEGIPQG